MLEVYLNLGIIGLSLLGWFFIFQLPDHLQELKPLFSFGALSLALWTALLFHSITEAELQKWSDVDHVLTWER